MEPRIHVLTLGVSDLQRALAFYRSLGLESPGVIGTEFEGDMSRDTVAPLLDDSEVEHLLTGKYFDLFRWTEWSSTSRRGRSSPGTKTYESDRMNRMNKKAPSCQWKRVVRSR